MFARLPNGAIRYSPEGRSVCSRERCTFTCAPFAMSHRNHAAAASTANVRFAPAPRRFRYRSVYRSQRAWQACQAAQAVACAGPACGFCRTTLRQTSGARWGASLRDHSLMCQAQSPARKHHLEMLMPIAIGLDLAGEKVWRVGCARSKLDRSRVVAPRRHNLALGHVLIECARSTADIKDSGVRRAPACADGKSSQLYS